MWGLFQIAVNGVHFTEFRHRMPMENVKYLFISGNFMKINFIKYEGGSVSITYVGRCACVREREREMERLCVCMYTCTCVCVNVCVCICMCMNKKTIYEHMYPRIALSVHKHTMGMFTL